MTTTIASDFAGSIDVAPGSHVCWIVEDPALYLRQAGMLLRQARAANEKPIVFGPEGGAALHQLAPLAAQAADPGRAFLGGGPLDPSAMFRMFREQSSQARREGYRRLRVVADMDWLLPCGPTTDQVVAFELLLDRLVHGVDATIVCAYRSASFDTETIAGALCVHPDIAGSAAPPFRFVATDDATWSLAGEVDVSVSATFNTAFSTVAGAGDCVVDVSALEFIDVASMRLIAQTGRQLGTTIRLIGAPPVLRRNWQLAGFDDVARSVEFVPGASPRGSGDRWSRPPADPPDAY